MSNTARKIRKQLARFVDGVDGMTAPKYRHAVKTGTPFAERLANRPRDIYGITASPSPTRFGVTSRTAAGYRARGLTVPREWLAR